MVTVDLIFLEHFNECLWCCLLFCILKIQCQNDHVVKGFHCVADLTVYTYFVMTTKLFLGQKNVCVCLCLQARMRMCVCVHSLSVGDVRALKQKPSLGFCLAGSFMQLSVLKKGGYLDFFYFRKPSFRLFFHAPLPLMCICSSLLFAVSFKQFSCFLLTGKNERPPYAPFGGQVCCLQHYYLCVTYMHATCHYKDSHILSLLISCESTVPVS